VEPHQSTSVRITFIPVSGVNTLERELSLEIRGGSKKTVRCIGQVNETKCTISEKSLEFGTIAVGMFDLYLVRLMRPCSSGVGSLVRWPYRGLQDKDLQDQERWTK